MTAQSAAAATPTRIDVATLGADAGKLKRLSVRDLGLRFAFGAAVSVVAALIGEWLGERAGGVLLAFPAILPAALTLIERREGTSSAVSDVRGATAGAVGLLCFAITVAVLAQRIQVILALLIASAAWTAIGTLCYFGGRALAGIVGDELYLPEVAVSEAEPLVETLRRRGLTVAVAESCTGGALAGLLTAVPGASKCVQGGVVAYTDEIKQAVLRIPSTTLERHGAISEETAVSMAEGVRDVLHADLGISSSGVIGAPVDGKEPGTIYVCASGPMGTLVTLLRAEGSPESQRSDALRSSLKIAQRLLERGP
ncbi:MAG TPA: nicotinamide-nucleotide amidohydrolase family protein [Candidatus Dormibacteraeota bacterium]|nr:nicotinamide-nucleotide amidohydrolase family protein [Candidatus Dormibacteraeota bacterium]